MRGLRLFLPLLFATVAAAQSSQAPVAYALPDVPTPTVSQPKNSYELPPERRDGRYTASTSPSRNLTVDDVKESGFWRGHPTRTKLIFAAIGGGIGLTVALTTRHNCPKFINGYAYDGTPPCPGKDYDPGEKALLRWRF